MFKKCRILLFKKKSFSTKPKPHIVVPDEKVFNEIESNAFKPKNHPGVFKPRFIPMSEEFMSAVNNVIEDHPIKALLEDGKELINHLRDKRPPVELDEFKQIKQRVQEDVLSQVETPVFESEEAKTIFQKNIANKVNIILRKSVYHWKPVNYNSYNALVYLLSRFPAEYSVLAKIFKELSERDSEFKPRSLFDFGSGVGSVMWAAKLYWKPSIFEYFNVDSSSEMNDLSQVLLQNGRGNSKLHLKGVYYRQFLPASNAVYDLVVCAYTLLELPSRQARLDTILNLWNKTNKYLVVVEQGSNAGFKIINEIRDFLLYTKSSNTECHVFSPCPHDQVCPRFTTDDGTPCNFEAFYYTFPIGKVSVRKPEHYSYVILKKGARSNKDPQWPRVVRETLVRSKHTICRMCTKDAELKEVIFTASKHGKNLYHCARATKWGELLPITLRKNEEGS